VRVSLVEAPNFRFTVHVLQSTATAVRCDDCLSQEDLLAQQIRMRFGAATPEDLKKALSAHSSAVECAPANATQKRCEQANYAEALAFQQAPRARRTLSGLTAAHAGSSLQRESGFASPVNRL